MKKNIFVTNGKNITIGKGKIDLATANSAFKEKVQLFADGINKMNDKRLYYSDCVKTAKHSLDLYEKGTFVDGSVVEAKLAEIEQYKTAVADITADIKKAMPTYDDTDKNLFYAYREYVDGDIDHSRYVRAWAEFLDNANVVPTDKGIEFLSAKIGTKKLGAKTMCKNGGTQFVGAMGEKQYLEMVYRVIAEAMYSKQILKPYKYEYVIEDKKAKTNA